MPSPLYPIILAGGSGERLWPLSRRDRPKPLLAPTGGPTLLERTWERACRLAPAENIFVATAARLEAGIRELLPELRPGNLILEPCARDTGPAAVYASWSVERRHPGATVALLPADHLMSTSAFLAALAAAHGVVDEHDGLVCLGVQPTRPSTSFGYILCEGSAPPHAAACPVARFVEKPSSAEAKKLIDGGRVLWNAGIFVWRAATFLGEASRLSPELSAAAQGLEKGGEAEEFFRDVQPIPVDRAVMERTRRAWVVGSQMEWDDLGGWDAVARHLVPDEEGNRGTGRRVTMDSSGCLVSAQTRPVVLVGVSDLVIVECPDVVLVAKRGAAESLRQIPRKLKEDDLEGLS